MFTPTGVEVRTVSGILGLLGNIFHTTSAMMRTMKAVPAASIHMGMAPRVGAGAGFWARTSGGRWTGACTGGAFWTGGFAGGAAGGAGALVSVTGFIALGAGAFATGAAGALATGAGGG